MSIEQEFSEYQDIWDDCNLGYVICENKSGLSGLPAINEIISKNARFNSYKSGISQLSQRVENEAQRLFFEMTNEAISMSYGDHRQLSDDELYRLFYSFIRSVGDGEFFTNFSDDGWFSLTNHTRDSLFCLVGKEKIGMWFSYDDE